MRNKNYRNSDYFRISLRPLKRGKRLLLVTLNSYHDDKFALRFKSEREFRKWLKRHVSKQPYIVAADMRRDLGL